MHRSNEMRGPSAAAPRSNRMSCRPVRQSNSRPSSGGTWTGIQSSAPSPLPMLLALTPLRPGSPWSRSGIVPACNANRGCFAPIECSRKCANYHYWPQARFSGTLRMSATKFYICLLAGRWCWTSPIVPGSVLTVAPAPFRVTSCWLKHADGKFLFSTRDSMPANTHWCAGVHGSTTVC